MRKDSEVKVQPSAVGSGFQTLKFFRPSRIDTMAHGYNNFMNNKDFHPANFTNQRRVS